MQFNIKEQQILQYAMEHGIIDLADVSADVETITGRGVTEGFILNTGTMIPVKRKRSAGHRKKLFRMLF